MFSIMEYPSLVCLCGREGWCLGLFQEADHPRKDGGGVGDLRLDDGCPCLLIQIEVV